MATFEQGVSRVAQAVQSGPQRLPAGTSLPIRSPRHKDQRETSDDWQLVSDFQVLRSADALHAEFLKRKQEEDPKRLGALLYAVMKFPQHPEAVEMLNCCAVNRFMSAQSTLHLVQALRGFDLALKLVKPGAYKWKIAINRLGLLRAMGAPSVVLRNAGWLVAEVPASHPLYHYLCYIMGTCYSMVGRLDMASYALERAVELIGIESPRHHDSVHLAWARTLARLGELERAEAVLHKVLDQSSGYWWAVQAELQFKKRNWLNFLALSKKAIGVFPPQAPWSWDRLAVAELHFQTAIAYKHVGRSDLSAKHLAVGQVLGAVLGFDGQRMEKELQQG